MTSAFTPDSATRDEMNWAVAAHLSNFLFAWIALGVMGPALILFVKGQSSDFVKQHALEAVNFNITALIGLAIGGLLIWLLGIGLLVIGFIGILYFIETLRGANRARKGKPFRYLCSVRFFT